MALSLEAGSIIASRYRLEKVLAVGGMGSIWVARHLQLDSQVALKFMAPLHAESSEGRERFKREAKISAELRVPNVVQVYDYGVDNDTPYLAMELLEGEDLAARLRRELRLTPAATLGIVHQVSKALGRAHEMGLVHRDIKPANIFLARQGGEEIVKVLDFGIAKSTTPLLAGTATKTGTLLGSPYYMSPEQVRRSKQVDPRSDLWALGVIVFECLTGRRPFQGEELGEVLVEICTADIPITSTIVPELGPGVDAFFSRALAREQNQRFQSAREFMHAFAAVVASLGSGIGAAWPPAQGERAPARERLATGAPPASLQGVGSLAPSGNSVALAPGPRRRVGFLMAALGAALTLGLVLFLTIRREAPPATSDAAAEVLVSSGVSSDAPRPPPPSAALPGPSATSSNGAPPPPGSNSPRPSLPRKPEAPKGGPAPSPKPKAPHDPLDRP